MMWELLGLHVNFEPLLLLVAEMICLKGLGTGRLFNCIELRDGRRKVFYRKVQVRVLAAGLNPMQQFSKGLFSK